MTTWHDTHQDLLQLIEAYDAMCVFLAKYWERGGRSSDDIGALLGTIDRNRREDLPPIDIAQWNDWLRAVSEVKERD